MLVGEGGLINDIRGGGGGGECKSKSIQILDFHRSHLTINIFCQLPAFTCYFHSTTDDTDV